MLSFRQFIHNNRGVAALEAAIVLPVFLMLIMGIIECGLIYHVNSLTNYAANEAARLAKTGTHIGYASQEDMIRQTVIKSLGSWYKKPTDITITHKSYITYGEVAGGNGTPGAGPISTYQVTYNWVTLTPVLMPFLNGKKTFSISSTILVQDEI